MYPEFIRVFLAHTLAFQRALLKFQGLRARGPFLFETLGAILFQFTRIKLDSLGSRPEAFLSQNIRICRGIGQYFEFLFLAEYHLSCKMQLLIYKYKKKKSKIPSEN